MKPNPYVLKEAKALIERRAPVAELRAWADKHGHTPRQVIRMAEGNTEPERERVMPPQPRGEAAATILFAQQHGRLPDDLPVPA